ncbi:MAG: DUF3108 domain-containing protein [Cytophagales bacterium]|nr:DUF3108 domain-containing protein [Cytophagales bacterium]
MIVYKLPLRIIFAWVIHSIAWSQGKTVLIPGEKITYSIHYSFINAAHIEVFTDTNIYETNSKPCYKSTVRGTTRGVAGLFAKISDRWESFIDTSTSQSHKFVRDINENNYRLYETTEFDRDFGHVYVTTKTGAQSYELKTHKITSSVQDMVSCYYDLRYYSFNNIKKNDTIKLQFFIQDTTITMHVKYLKRDKIRTAIGKYKSYILSPILPDINHSIFSKSDPVKIWISDDATHIPLRIRLSTKYGAIEAEIDNYEVIRKK